MNILIIENQKEQYRIIVSLLDKTSGDFTIHPKLDTIDKKGAYEKFMDHVRITLNNRYEKTRRKASAGKIVEYINKEKIDIILMDHKLIGFHTAQDGIDLARELRNTYKITIPILFLSRTPQNSQVEETATQKDLQIKYTEVKPPVEWVEKGYAGGALLDEFYFQNKVFNKIVEMVQKADMEIKEYKDKITEICNHYSEMRSKNYKKALSCIEKLDINRIKSEPQLKVVIDAIAATQIQPENVEEYLTYPDKYQTK